MTNLKQLVNTNWNIIFLCWLIASTSALGSMFFSEIMDFPPCVLCWYQRVFMFPLAIILLTGLFPYDKSVIKFSLPLAVGGLCFAIYHSLVYAGFIPENLQPCSQGVSCSDKYIELFGFITIPMLSLISFSIIVSLLLVLLRRNYI